MDEIISHFFEQCEIGRVVVDDIYYNLHFSLNNNPNCLNIKVKDKELLYKYIKEFLLLFNFENVNQIYKKLVYLFSNLTFSDCDNIYEYIKRNILFVKNKILYDTEITFNENKIKIKIMDSYQETPYCFKAFISSGESSYELPTISYGIADDICYIYAIQDKNKDKTSPYNKKIKRILYKMNNGIKETQDYEQYKNGESDYYPENISDVSPSSVLALTIFLKQLSNLSIKKIKVVPFLPIRYNAKEEAYKNRIDYLLKYEQLENKNEMIEYYKNEHLRIQNNLTQKFIRNFFRVSYHFPNVLINSIPYETDEYLNITLKSFEVDIFDNLGLDKIKK